MTADEAHDAKRDRETPAYVQMDGHVVEIPATDELLRKVHAYQNRKVLAVRQRNATLRGQRKMLGRALLMSVVAQAHLVALIIAVSENFFSMSNVDWAWFILIPALMVAGVTLQLEGITSWWRSRPTAHTDSTNLARAFGVEEDSTHM
jgi:hypothetical protein